MAATKQEIRIAKAANVGKWPMLMMVEGDWAEIREHYSGTGWVIGNAITQGDIAPEDVDAAHKLADKIGGVW